MQKFVQRYLLWLIIAAALLLRLPEYFISLAYDEIWTLQNFVPLSAGELFFDLELPNNHPLNSLLVKFIASVTLAPETIRLPNLLAALGSLLLVWYLTKKCWGGRAAYWSIFFLALSVPHLVYSVQARGYSLQIFFLLLYAAGLTGCHSGKKSFYCSLAAIAGAVGAITTLPTSCIYLCGITLILWNLSGCRKPGKNEIITVAVSAILALTYILINLGSLLAARKWGGEIVSASGYCLFIGNTLYMLVSPVLLVFLAWGAFKARKLWWSAAALLIMLFGSALFTNAGPPRVYLPLAAAGAILCGIGAAALHEKVKEKYRMLFVLGVVLISCAAYQLQMPVWRFTNYIPVINEALDLPPEVLVVYPASESFQVLGTSSGKTAVKYEQQLFGTPTRLMLIKSSGEITGGDEKYTQQTAVIPLNGEKNRLGGVAAVIYDLEAVTDALDADAPLIAIAYNSKIVPALTGQGNALMLNLFFHNSHLPDNRRLTISGWYIKPGALRKYLKNGLPAEAGYIRLFKIKAR